MTKREREILHSYTTHGIKLDGFSMTILRAKRWDKKWIDKDIELIMKALEKFDSDPHNSDFNRNIYKFSIKRTEG
ncbi:MAG: hypothetical protein QW279_02710 [Candidatus Jordarchaeaceae archaeon]